jgi:hypothetical protein
MREPDLDKSRLKLLHGFPCGAATPWHLPRLCRHHLGATCKHPSQLSYFVLRPVSCVECAIVQIFLPRSTVSMDDFTKERNTVVAGPGLEDVLLDDRFQQQHEDDHSQQETVFDKRDMRRLGRRQEVKRRFRFFSIVGYMVGNLFRQRKSIRFG